MITFIVNCKHSSSKYFCLFFCNRNRVCQHENDDHHAYPALINFLFVQNRL